MESKQKPKRVSAMRAISEKKLASLATDYVPKQVRLEREQRQGDNSRPEERIRQAHIALAKAKEEERKMLPFCECIRIRGTLIYCTEGVKEKWLDYLSRQAGKPHAMPIYRQTPKRNLKATPKPRDNYKYY